MSEFVLRAKYTILFGECGELLVFINGVFGLKTKRAVLHSRALL